MVFSACAPKPAAESPAAEAPAAEVTDTQPEAVNSNPEAQKEQAQKSMTFSLAEIDGWTKVPGSSALLHYMKGPSNVIVTRDSMPSDVGSPEEYFEFTSEKLGETLDSFSLGDTSEIGVSDPGKYLLVYSINAGSSSQMKFWNASIIDGSTIYTLTCAALSDSFPSAEKDFKKFIESFKLVPEE
jgi:hypothetical protein